MDFKVVGDATTADIGMALPTQSSRIVPEGAARSIAIHLAERPDGLMTPGNKIGEEET